MNSKKSLKVAAVALLFVLSAPVASAASLSQNVDCEFAKGDHAACVERALNVTYKLPDPIGIVAYAPRCDYFIIRADEQFVIAKDIDKSDDVRRGDAIYANKRERGNDFKRGSSELLVGTTKLRTLILETVPTAHDAAVAYTAKCSR
jgi:hypothetical protein